MKNSKKHIVALLLVALLLIGNSPLTGILNLSVEAVNSDAIGNLGYTVYNVNNVSGQQIVAEAAKWVGTPYGGSGLNGRTGYGSKKSFDCSGFVYRVLKDLNFQSDHADSEYNKVSNTRWYITAHTGNQRYYGYKLNGSVIAKIKKNDLSNLLPGDLLFFDYNNDDYTDHVGIYSGNGKFWNANSSHGIKEDDLFPDWNWCNGKKAGELVFAASRLITTFSQCSYTFVTNKANLGIRDIPYDKDEAKHEVSEITTKGTKVHASKEYVNIYGNTWYYIDSLVTNNDDPKFTTPGWTYVGHLKDKEQCKQSFSTGTQKNSKNDKITNMPAPVVVNQDAEITLSNQIPKRDGYTFIGWSRDPNATVAEKQPGDKITASGNVTWYPVWKPTEVTMKLSKYTISVDKTGVSQKDSEYISLTAEGDISSSKKYTVDFVSDNSSVAQGKVKNSPLEVSGIVWKKASGELYFTCKSPGSANVKITLKGDGKALITQSVHITVTESYKIQFNNYDNTACITTQTKKHGQDLTLTSTIPTKDYSYFIGWKYNNSDEMYGPGDLLKKDAAATMYPLFVDKEYTKCSPSADGKTLTISGNGPMASYPIGNRPWESYKSTATKVVIESGVTSIGAYAFKNFTALTEVQIADTVERLGSEAFSGCTNLYKINKPASLKYWGTKAFQNCKSLSDFSLPAAKSSKAASSTEGGLHILAICFFWRSA